MQSNSRRVLVIIKNTSFRFIDLFAGIGGFRIGFEEIGGKCVFTSEWNAWSQQTYRLNFSNDHRIEGNIRPFADNPSLIPAHDVLLAGFPCQPFSIAGVSKKNALGRPHGFLCDTQGTLFFDTARIIKAHRPKMFVLENVKNLQRHDSGQTFSTIMNVLRLIVGFRELSGFDFETMSIPPSESGPNLWFDS